MKKPVLILSVWVLIGIVTACSGGSGTSHSVAAVATPAGISVVTAN